MSRNMPEPLGCRFECGAQTNLFGARSATMAEGSRPPVCCRGRTGGAPAYSGSTGGSTLLAGPWRSIRPQAVAPRCKSKSPWRTEMSIQILLADDHPLVRQGLKLLLEREGFKVTAEAGNGHEAVKLAQELHPDVALIDLAMPLLNGLDAIHEIQKVSPKTKTILLTMHTESHYILQGVRAGAKGVVLKTHASEDLVRAIREASRGGTYMSPEVSRALVQAYQGKTELRPDPLSPRERQVLQLIAEGKTTKEVATFLQISVKTAETHRTRIMTKLNIHETAGLVRYAIRSGLTQA